MLRMERVDLSDQQRLREITELLRTVSTIEEPQELQKQFSISMAKLYPLHAYVGLSRRGLGEGEYKVTRLILNAKDREGFDHNPWETWPQIPIETGGILGTIIADDEPKLYRNLHITDDPVLGSSLAEMKSMMAIPLFDEGKAMNWGIVFHKDNDGLDPAGLDEFTMRGNLIGRMTRGLVMRQEVERLNAKLTSQLTEIAEIQRSLLPQKTPCVPGIKLATSYLTSDESGGDYFDFFEMEDGRWGVLIADVSGHGAGAATVVAMRTDVYPPGPTDTAIREISRGESPASRTHESIDTTSASSRLDARARSVRASTSQSDGLLPRTIATPAPPAPQDPPDSPPDPDAVSGLGVPALATRGGFEVSIASVMSSCVLTRRV